MENQPTLKNGIYKSHNATYFVKDQKIMMLLRGWAYKTTEAFMIGASFVGPLTPGQEEIFDKAYETAHNW